jgi:hypothetical protein
MNKNPLEQSRSTKIPGYSGYIPSIKSENIHGSTYGKTTKQSERGVFQKGSTLPPSLRFTSTNQANFVDQMQYHDPLDDIVAPSSDNQVPLGEISKFFQSVPDDQDTLAKNAEVFYGDGSLYWQKKEREKETLQQASSKFFNHAGDRAEVDPSAWSTLPLSYSEAKARAYK